ncbi:MAG: peptidase M64, partial [Bacteroidetes bacterium]|nr:peptidase M64 [Bacteroidota bacterium]
MKKLLFILLLFPTIVFSTPFDSLFYNKTLRVDVIHAGDKTTDAFYLDELIEEPYWGGSHVNLLDAFDY